MSGRNSGRGTTEYLTAESERGRQALREVMQRSYSADVGAVPASWAQVRVVDGVAVSFVLVDPNRELDFPGGSLRYGFICDAATRTDRRREGHFRAALQHAGASLRRAGIPLALTHGRCALYRPLGFVAFTHHCGVFVTPAQVECRLGDVAPDGAEQLLTIEEGMHLQEDLLLVSEVRAQTVAECRAVLLAAADLARERGRSRILFEHPRAPSYGSRYPIYKTPETPLANLAQACGGELRIGGSDPEGRPVPDADWIVVLDATRLLQDAVGCLATLDPVLPPGQVCFQTEAGGATVGSLNGKLSVSAYKTPGSAALCWPGSALAQLVTGYCSVAALCEIHGTPLEAEELDLVRALFPRRWRFSRNESWTFRP